MPGYKFASLDAFVHYCKKLVRERDLDCVILFSGEPGNGKSTFEMQLAMQLDPTLTLDHVHFTNEDFLNDARSREKYHVVVGDELFLHRRKHSTASTMEVIEFLQACRGLNLFLLISFPWAGKLDRDVLDLRVRYKIEIVRPENDPGAPPTAYVYERHYVKLFDHDGEEHYAVNWVLVLPPIRYRANKGDFWESYQVKKIDAARRRNALAKGVDPDSPEAKDGLSLPMPGARRRSERGYLEEKEKRKRHRGSQPKFLQKYLQGDRVPHSALRTLREQDAGIMDGPKSNMTKE